VSITQHPIENLATAMAAQTWASLSNTVLGARLFKYALPPVSTSSAGTSPVSDIAVALVPSGGPAPRSRFMGDKNEWEPRVSVIVRGDRRVTKASYDLALEIMRWAQNRSVSGYLRVSVESSDPINLGPDEGDRMRWEIPVRMWFYA
jgi:hypothetical protein